MCIPEEQPNPSDRGQVSGEPLHPSIPRETQDKHPHSQRIYRQEMTQLIFVLAWCSWLLISWMLTLWINGQIQVMHWMLTSVAIGQILAWPTFRLSQRLDLHGGKIESLVFRDWLSMMMILQMVVWPLKFSGHWQWGQMIFVLLAMAGLGLVVGLLLVWGCRRQDAIGRIGAMLGCLGLGFGEILGERFLGWGIWMIRPFEMYWAMTGQSNTWTVRPWLGEGLCLAIVGLLGWGWLWVGSWGRCSLRLKKHRV